MVIYGWLKVAFGIFCLGKTCGGIFYPGKSWCQHLLPRQHMSRCYVLTGGMILLSVFVLLSDIVVRQSLVILEY